MSLRPHANIKWSSITRTVVASEPNVRCNQEVLRTVRVVSSILALETLMQSRFILFLLLDFNLINISCFVRIENGSNRNGKL